MEYSKLLESILAGEWKGFGEIIPLRKTAQLQSHANDSLKVNCSPCILYSTYLIGHMASTLTCSLYS